MRLFSLVLSSLRRPPRSARIAAAQAIEDEKAAPLAYDACKALSLLERAGVAGGELLVRFVAERR